MNEYDSAKLADVLVALHRMEVTQNLQEAGVLLHTCSSREKAQEKVCSEPGCRKKTEGEALRKRAPYVDIVFGPQTILDDVRRARRL